MNEVSNKDLFSGRKLVIATKHKKEEVIAPVFSRLLNVDCVYDFTIDTDILGTFTGEVDRKDDVLTTARKKCLMALENSDCDMAIASEGSFGPHPFSGFFNADDEILLFIDRKYDLEIVVRELSVITNFKGKEIKTEKELLEFAETANFPSHGLIIRKKQDDFFHIVKGISDYAQLNKTFREFKDMYGSAYVETDMRAMYNPTRMEVIKSAAQKLAHKILSCCPECTTPGFGVIGTISGLPCNQCGFPTRSVLSHTYKCLKCDYSENRKYPNGKETEEPVFCDNCNP